MKYFAISLIALLLFLSGCVEPSEPIPIGPQMQVIAEACDSGAVRTEDYGINTIESAQWQNDVFIVEAFIWVNCCNVTVDAAFDVTDNNLVITPIEVWDGYSSRCLCICPQKTTFRFTELPQGEYSVSLNDLIVRTLPVNETVCQAALEFADDCWLALAWDTNNLNYCQSIENDYLKEECLLGIPPEPPQTEEEPIERDPLLEEAEEFCDDQDVGAVYVCGDLVRVVSMVPGAGSTFYRSVDDEFTQELQCPLVAPDSMSPECYALIIEPDCAELEICINT